MARQNNEDDYIDTIKQKLDEIAEQLNHSGKEEYITGKFGWLRTYCSKSKINKRNYKCQQNMTQK